jgi:cytochrome P450
MEDIFNRHIDNIRTKVDKYVQSGEAFDLKEIMSYYGYDVTGELSFSTQYGSQEADDPTRLPPINDHVLLSCMYGSVADLLPVPTLRTITSWVPSAWIQGLLKSRAYLRDNAGRCVKAAIEDHKTDKKAHNLLTQLIEAKDPETGAELDFAEIASEAFGFLQSYSPYSQHLSTLY